MLADTLALHEQNFFLACATAIPVLFVAISVQVVQAAEQSSRDRFGGSPLYRLVSGYAFYICSAGELAAVYALFFDARGWLVGLLAGGGLVVAMVVVTMGVASLISAGR